MSRFRPSIVLGSTGPPANLPVRSPYEPYFRLETPHILRAASLPDDRYDRAGKQEMRGIVGLSQVSNDLRVEGEWSAT